ncbi:MAG: response regulator [Lachnospiraceae bacterium]|nr:response regulator [Lachnospiraceae bacterium]
MRLLMVDDEFKYRCDFENYISNLMPTLDYPIDFYLAEGESEALILVQNFDFDSIILELELNNSDGDGISFLKKMKALNLPKKPYVIIVTFNSSHLSKEIARDNGADYFIWKMKKDFSPKLVIDHVLDYFQLKSKDMPNEAFPGEASLEQKILALINKNGFTDDMSGKQYVIDAIIIATQLNKPKLNLHNDIFPAIARKYNKSISSINRAIENAISKAWCITDEKIIAECYPLSVNGEKGVPTNKEFIFYYMRQFKEN